MAHRLQFLLLVAVVLAQLHTLSCDTLRGSVTCLDCDEGHHLSGVVVAVQCRDFHRHGQEMDSGGNFDVAMPEVSVSRCVARVLGGTEKLCAPQKLTVARIVAGREPDSYTLGSRLAIFTRCGVLATMATSEKRPPSASPPRLPSSSSPPNGLGVPLIYVFPFIPIIGIP
ncbi:unnamed protein product [Alopecurus aequalis]